MQLRKLQPCNLSIHHTCNAAWAPALTFLSSSSNIHPLLTALVKEYVLPQLDERLCPEWSEESFQKHDSVSDKPERNMSVFIQNHLKCQKQKRVNCHVLHSFHVHYFLTSDQTDSIWNLKVHKSFKSYVILNILYHIL